MAPLDTLIPVWLTCFTGKWSINTVVCIPLSVFVNTRSVVSFREDNVTRAHCAAYFPEGEPLMDLDIRAVPRDGNRLQEGPRCPFPHSSVSPEVWLMLFLLRWCLLHMLIVFHHHTAIRQTPCRMLSAFQLFVIRHGNVTTVSTLYVPCTTLCVPCITLCVPCTTS